MHDNFRHRALGWWAELIARHPWWTLGLAALITVVSFWLSTFHLGFQSDRNKLVSEKLEWNKRFINWRESFPGEDDLYVVIDTGESDPKPDSPRVLEARRLADSLGTALLKSGQLQDQHSAVWRFQTHRASPRMVRALPMEDFRKYMAQVAGAAPVIDSNSPQNMLAAIEAQMGSPKSRNESPAEQAKLIAQLRIIINAYAAVLSAPPGAVPRLTDLTSGDAGTNEWTYLTSTNGRLYFIRVTPRRAEGELNALAPAIGGIREILAQNKPQVSGVEVGLTGIEVVEADETEAATQDAAIASTVSLVLITLLLILAYHSIKTPVLAMSALLVGVTWSFGFAALAIGHLQVLSVIFAAMLLGISDAYGVHVVARFEIVRHNYPDTIDGFVGALRESFQAMGPGIISGALVTASSFITTVFTNFTGVAEMGLISGVGIVLCLTAMFTVYPALLRLFKPWHRNIVPPQDRRIAFYKDKWVMPFVRHPKATVAVSMILLVIALIAVSQMHFNYDLLKLQPRGVESVEWARKISEEGGQSIYSGISIANNMADARRWAKEFRKLPTVESLGGVGLLMPDQEEEKLRVIYETRAVLGLPVNTDTLSVTSVAASMTKPSIPTHPIAPKLDFVTAVAGMQLRLKLATQFVELPPPVQTAITDLTTAMNQIPSMAQKWSPTERAQRNLQLQRAYDEWKQDILGTLDTKPLELTDLPEELLRPYIAEKPGDSRVILEIFPKLPDRKTTGIDSALHPKFLPGFIRDMRTVDKNVTGVIVQIYESGSLIKHAYVQSGIFAMLIVFVLVLIDFRSLTYTLLAMAPVALGFAVTFGVMWLCGVSINPANIIVLPLMFGIGVDSGIHILHRYKQDPVNRPLGLASGTGKAITITALTTIIGFAALIFARHRGISSLGFVLTVGLTLTLIACIAVMPAGLELLERWKPVKRES